jgi:hypothetical protein
MTISKILARSWYALIFMVPLGLVACGGGGGGGVAALPAEPVELTATLTGDQEVPPVVTAATGSGSVVINGERTQLDFTLDVTGLFTSPIEQAHIHVGAAGVNGPVILFLCSDLDPPTGVPLPPLCSDTLDGPAGLLTGTLTAADLIARPEQGVNTFADAVNALLAGNTYMNVHTVNNPGGEIRGQLGVVVDVAATVWYVDNTVAGGNGTLASPFGTLAQAEAASAPGEIIFVFAGNGTDTGQNLGITLKAGQKLIGQGVGLGTIPPGASPVISNEGLAVPGNIPVVMLSTGNEVAGLTINAAFNDGILALGGTGHIVRDNTFTFDAVNGREGVRLLNVTGSASVMRNTMTGSLRAGIKLANNENQAGDVVAATPIAATVTMSANTISGSDRAGIDVTLDGIGTDVTLSILNNSIADSTDEGIDIDGLGQANINALVQLNDLSGSGGAADFRATINNTSTICLELIDNGNLAGNATFEVNNNTGVAGAFRFFEALNDELANRIGDITNVPQGTCVP